MVYVSSYEEKFREGLADAISQLPEEHAKMIDKITDTICEAIQEKVRASTVEFLAEAIKDDITSRAASVAESMLMNALAGDDRTIRNLFNFNDWYLTSPACGSRQIPTKAIHVRIGESREQHSRHGHV